MKFVSPRQAQRIPSRELAGPFLASDDVIESEHISDEFARRLRSPENNQKNVPVSGNCEEFTLAGRYDVATAPATVAPSKTELTYPVYQNQEDRIAPVQREVRAMRVRISKTKIKIFFKIFTGLVWVGQMQSGTRASSKTGLYRAKLVEITRRTRDLATIGD